MSYFYLLLCGCGEGVVFGFFLVAFLEAESFFDFFRSITAGVSTEASCFNGNNSLGINSDFNGFVHNRISCVMVVAAATVIRMMRSWSSGVSPRMVLVFGIWIFG